MMTRKCSCGKNAIAIPYLVLNHKIEVYGGSAIIYYCECGDHREVTLKQLFAEANPPASPNAVTITWPPAAKVEKPDGISPENTVVAYKHHLEQLAAARRDGAEEFSNRLSSHFGKQGRPDIGILIQNFPIDPPKGATP
jgi:hypothetical protein